MHAQEALIPERHVQVHAFGYHIRIAFKSISLTPKMHMPCVRQRSKATLGVIR